MDPEDVTLRADTDALSYAMTFMEIKELTAMAATCKVKRDLAHREINRRHEAYFGQTDKSVYLKMKDLYFHKIVGTKFSSSAIRGMLDLRLTGNYWTTIADPRQRLAEEIEGIGCGKRANIKTSLASLEAGLLQLAHDIMTKYPDSETFVKSQINRLVEVAEGIRGIKGIRDFLPRAKYYRAEHDLDRAQTAAELKRISTIKDRQVQLRNNHILYSICTNDDMLHSALRGHTTDELIDMFVSPYRDHIPAPDDAVGLAHVLTEHETQHIRDLLNHRTRKLGYYKMTLNYPIQAPRDYVDGIVSALMLINEDIPEDLDLPIGMVHSEALSKLRRLPKDVLFYIHDDLVHHYYGIDVSELPSDIDICQYAKGVVYALTHHGLLRGHATKIIDNRDTPGTECPCDKYFTWY